MRLPELCWEVREFFGDERPPSIHGRRSSPESASEFIDQLRSGRSTDEGWGNYYITSIPKTKDS